MGSERLRFTIVTPSYNQAPYLRQAMRSVIEQEDVDLEYIVIDGGSSDGSVEIIRNLSDHVAAWESARDGGQTDALNKGMSRATGEVVGWLNSDDCYVPGALKLVAQRFSTADEPDVVFGFGVTIDQCGKFVRENRCAPFSLSALANHGFDIFQPAMFWRRRWNDVVLPLDSSLRFAMDVELVSRLAEAGATFALLPAFLAAFRIHGRSKTSNIASVGNSEAAGIAHRIRMRTPAARQRVPRSLLTLQRRLRLAASGSWRYALLGGKVGASRAGLLAAEQVRVWADAKSVL